MNYEKIYNDIVAKARAEDRRKIKGGIYYEAHHIIPKCLGGDGKTSQHKHPNIILLTAKEHYICHRLLCEIYPNNNKLVYAFWRMINSSGGNNDRYILSGNEFKKIKEEIKIKLAGRIISSDTKKKMSISSKNRPPMSEKTRKKLSDNSKGKNNPGSKPEVIAKRVATMTKKSLNGIYGVSGNRHANYKGVLEQKILKYKGGIASGNATQVEIDGVNYDSYKAASRVFGIAGETISRRCKSDKYPAWKIIKEYKKDDKERT